MARHSTELTPRAYQLLLDAAQLTGQYHNRIIEAALTDYLQKEIDNKPCRCGHEDADVFGPHHDNLCPRWQAAL